MLLKDAIEIYLKSGFADATVKIYGAALDSLKEHVGSDIEITAICPVDLDAWDITLRNEERGLSTASINTYRRGVKAFWRWAAERELITRSPFKIKIGSAIPDPFEIERKAISPETRELLLVASKVKPRDHALIRVLADTGCRVGELVSLRIGWIKRQKALVKGKTGFTYIYLPRASRNAIGDWLSVRPDMGHDYVFTNMNNGDALKSNGVNQMLERWAERLNLDKPYNPHSFRYAKIRDAVKAGVSPRKVQKLLGHKNLTTTLIFYEGFTEEDLSEIAELLSA